MDPFSLALGGAGLVTNILGGIFGRGAAKRAATAQANATQQGIDKVGAAVGEANAPIAAATSHAQDLATTSGNAVVDTAGRAAAGVNEATKNANEILNPFTSAGQSTVQTLQSGLTPGGEFNKPFSQADLQIDPGYYFRLNQGQQALERSAAARGGSMSGAALKDLAGYSQGLASQETQAAFGRYETDTQNRYDRLFGTSQLGAQTGTAQGNNLTAGARYGGDITTSAAGTKLGADEYVGTAGMQGAQEIGRNITEGARTQADLLTQKGNAEASGIVGGSNAMLGGITGGVNSAGSTLTLSKLLQNPAVGPVGYPAGYDPLSNGIPPAVMSKIIRGKAA